MKRELLLEKIEEYKSLMPWFVLEYYQSKLSVPYSFTTLYEYLKEYKRFFDWLIDSGISDADDIASIDIKTLENLTKKDMESFVLYLRERPSLNTYSKKQGVSQTTINRTLSALSSLYKYLTEEVEGPDGEPYFYRNVMKKVSTKKKKETLAARAENIKQKLFLVREPSARSGIAQIQIGGIDLCKKGNGRHGAGFSALRREPFDDKTLPPPIAVVCGDDDRLHF